jgi:hypothetical protein
VFEGRHGTAKLIRLPGREARAFDRDAHGLFLKQRYPQRLAEHALKLGFGIDGLLLSLAPPQIGMHHIALDRPWPDDRHLNDEIVKGARLDARQHRHLGAAFDLEGSERVGLADHCVGARVFGRGGREIERDSFVLGQKVKPGFMQLNIPNARQSTFMKISKRRCHLCPIQ